MVLTKQDLAEWNSHPVTKAIFKEIDSQIVVVSMESVVKDTADQTAMQAARNEGVIEGAQALKDAYEFLVEDLEDEE